MRKATNDDENVLSEDLVKIGRFLQSTLNLQNGVIGTGECMMNPGVWHQLT